MPKRPVSPTSLPAPEREARSRLRQLLSESGGFLHGSLIAMARRCGKPSCRCASDDQARHRSLCLGQTLGGKTTMVHIPADLEPLAREWVDNFIRADRLLEELSEQGRGRLAKAKAKSRARGSEGTAAPASRGSTRSTRATGAAKPKPPRKPS
jgi:hypothetical protein